MKYEKIVRTIKFELLAELDSFEHCKVEKLVVYGQQYIGVNDDESGGNFMPFGIMIKPNNDSEVHNYIRDL